VFIGVEVHNCKKEKHTFMDNRIYALVGPHASGKTALAAKMSELGIPILSLDTCLNDLPEGRETSPACCVSRQEFGNRQYLMTYTYHGITFGIRQQETLQALDENPTSIMLIDLPALPALKELLGERLVTIFLMVDYDVQIQRMLKMGADYETIRQQLQDDHDGGDVDGWKLTDCVIKNTGSLDDAANQLLAIMHCEKRLN